MQPIARLTAGLLLAGLGTCGSWAGGIRISDGGAARVDLRLARGADDSERTAASELSAYLTRITSAEFPIVVEGDAPERGPAIHIGPTEFARRHGIDGQHLGPEEWVLRSVGQDLIVSGGRPRGTLYAVYHLLEDQFGVRWWTPFEEQVPRIPRLKLRSIDARGKPAFVYRDLTEIPGPRRFCARSRMNGHYSELSPAYGGMEEYGNKHVHNFYLYVSPEEFFETHPEYFSEIAGLRYGGEGQLCLTEPRLPGLVAERILADIREVGRRAAQRGGQAPRLFAFSQNDWGRACDCAACTSLAEREGSRAGPLVEFLNQVAERIAADYPEVLLDTIAYSHTFLPPTGLRTRDNVTVRVSALYQRDYSKPVEHPANAAYREALEGWARATRHLRVWDYAVIFGEDGDLPLPNLAFLDDDFRFYLERGVEGIFMQQGDPIAADMRDLKQWVLLKLLEDPSRDSEPLIRRFTDGYYGPAAPQIRAYLAELGRQARNKPATIRFFADASSFTYLDLRFLVRAQRRFDRALRRASGDPERLRRVRHARLSLDMATLYRLPILEREFSATGRPMSGFPLQRAALVERLRRTWYEQVDLRVPEADREEARAEADEWID